MLKAFIVRPFGAKEGINFDTVQKELITPALAACDIQGDTTGIFLQAGNIRTDMFQQLLVADIVIADVSIHNANVFYELGVRHALQPARTFLLRAKVKKDPKERTAQDEVPFDIKTERYLEYDADNPADKLPVLKDALRQTLASDTPDSPVFQMLPDLEAQDRARFLPVPQTFREDVELAFKTRQLGLLGLLAMEARDFFWAAEGLRLVGRAQLNLKLFEEARDTWEELHRRNPDEPEANQRLGTIYQRLGDIDASDQALQRLLALKNVAASDRAEALSLLARNIKSRWRTAWSNLTADQAAVKALESPELERSYEKYREAFQEDLGSFYAGLNALSMLTIITELAKKLPDEWENRFDTEEQARAELEVLVLQRHKLAGAVGVALDAARQRLERSGGEDRWLEISLGDYLFLTSNRPKRVAFAYKSALDGAPDFNTESARAQLEIFRDLGILTENTVAALDAMPATPPPGPLAAKPARVILFTGHMMDPKDAATTRFPESIRETARAKIREAVQQELERTGGAVIALASGAHGGDLLFHDVCEELGVEHRLYLPLPPDMFRNESVSPAGRYWENHFDALLKRPHRPPCLASSTELPVWLSARSNYTSWQRANLWLIQVALSVHAGNFTLMALWDGVKREGLGGTWHMREVAKNFGAALVTIYTTDLLAAQAGAVTSST